MRKTSSRAMVAVLLVAASFLGACGDDPNDSLGGAAKMNEDGTQLVNGTVKEWEVSVDASRAKPGEITFTVSNEGSIPHEFLVVKTDVPPGEIPVEGDRFSEEDEALVMVDEIPEYEPGTTQELTVSLEAGTYQLVCNIAGHYSAGMHTSFVVEA